MLILRSDRDNGTVKLPVISTIQQDRERTGMTGRTAYFIFHRKHKHIAAWDVKLMYLIMLVYNFYSIFIIFKDDMSRFIG